MTREEIEKMEAGRKLDALVAKKVMGWTEIRAHKLPDWAFTGFPPLDHAAGFPQLRPVPLYSTDIAAAWQVWEKIAMPTIEKSYLTPEDITANRPGVRVWVEQDYMGPTEVAEAETAPLAICRAALLATLQENGK